MQERLQKQISHNVRNVEQESKNMAKAVGIDLGTTNSVVVLATKSPIR